MKEHSIKASDAQFIRLFRWIAGLQISSHAKLLLARLLDVPDGERDVRASIRFLRSWLSWSDPRYAEPPVSWRNSDGFAGNPR